MKTRAFAISFFVVLIAGPSMGQTSGTTLKERFLSEYTNAIQAWEAKYSHAEGKALYTEDDRRKKETPHREILFSFKCKLPDMAVMTSSTRTVAIPEDHVSGYNKEYSFALKKAGGGEYSIESLDAAQGAAHPPRDSAIQTTLRPILWSPYSSRSANLGLVTNPRFKLSAVTPLNRLGKNLAKVEFVLPSDPNRKAAKNGRPAGEFEGFLVLAPDEKWVLYEYECREARGGGGFLYKGTVEYQGVSDGFPIPKRVSRQRLKLPDGELVESHSYDFQDFQFVDVPDEDFTLAAFGIAEQVSQPVKAEARNRSLGYWFLGLAIAALAAAVFFKIASSRLRRVNVGRSC